MNSESKATFLKDEYLLLQKFYEDYDTRVITIKGWSATIGMAAISVGFYQSKFVWLFAAGASLVFWILEALWKSFQYMYAPRIKLLEDAFRSGNFDAIVPFQIYTAWFEQLREEGFQVKSNMLLGLVAFPHAVTLVAGIGLYAIEASGLATFPRGH